MSGALVALPFGLAIGLALGLVGGGGSILAVPVLVYAVGEPVRQATSESLLIVGSTALAGALHQARSGRVRWRTALAFGLAGIPGSLAGTALNRVADPGSIMVAFAALLLVAAFALVRRPTGGPLPESRGSSGLLLRAGPAGLAIGVLTGFFGVGGGFVIVPALVLLLALPMDAAVGTSLAVIAMTSASALAAHAASGRLDWAVAGSFTAAAIAGAVAGGRLGGRMPARLLAQVFAGLVVGVAIFLVVRNVGPLA